MVVAHRTRSHQAAGLLRAPPPLPAPPRSPCTESRRAAHASAAQESPCRTRDNIRRRLIQPRQRLIDLIESFRLHLNKRELDILLGVGFEDSPRAKLLTRFLPFRLGAHIAELVLDL